MPEATGNETPTKARRLAIHLPRPLWIGVVACVLIFAAVGLQFGLPFYCRQAAIGEIERSGGEIAERYHRGPNWLRSWVGEERMARFDGVTAASLGYSPGTDAALYYVGQLTELEDLDLSRTDVTDRGLAHLKMLTKLKRLSLDDTKITDRGLEQLEGLSNLRTLSLKHTSVTDAGLPRLKSCTSLRRLRVDNTYVTHAGMDDLDRAMPDLRIGW
jgi:hypothetical protein